MSEQKILPKGKTPATEEDIKALENKIYTSLMIAPDRVLDGVITSNESIISRMGEHKVRIRNKVDNIINSRNTTRYNFYKTFGADFTKGEVESFNSLFPPEGSRIIFIEFLVDRVTEINKIGPCLYYKNEVDRILQDYNDAVKLTINKYKEYYQKKCGEDKNLKPYENSDIKKLLDVDSNRMYDAVRVFNRTIEDNQMNTAEVKLQMNANKQSE